MELRYQPREYLQAAPDAILMAMGEKVEFAHPIAESFADAPLSTAAYAMGIEKFPGAVRDNPSAVIARALTTSDFSALVANGLRQLVMRSYEASADHLAFSVPVECRDYRPISTVPLDSSLNLKPIGQNGELESGSVVLGAGSQAQLKRLGLILKFSREMVFDDDLGAIRGIVGNLGTAAAMMEARELYAALEANPTLSDNSTLFDATHNNVVAEAFADTHLATAMERLRTNLTPAGNKGNLRAAHLVVSANLEFAAQRLIHDAGLKVNVVTTAELPAGRWYVLADPIQQPVVGHLRLNGAEAGPRVESSNRPMDCSGFAVRVIADIGAALMARTGIIRGGA